MRYAIGVDFGTESGRAVLVDVASGAELATAVHEFANGVIDRHLPSPDDDVRLEPDWALQDPDDYIATFRATIPSVLAQTGRRSSRRDRCRDRFHGVHDGPDEQRRHPSMPVAGVQA
jgi:ribulose kinase